MTGALVAPGAHLTLIEMAEIHAPELTPTQTAVLEKILKTGFRFVTFEKFARHLTVEKDGFVALLEPRGEKFGIFGQVGYRISEGIGVLVEQAGKKVFVWKKKSVVATPEMLRGYANFKAKLERLLETGN